MDNDVQNKIQNLLFKRKQLKILVNSYYGFSSKPNFKIFDTYKEIYEIDKKISRLRKINEIITI
jgi:DNA polymerase elongation subunit (family B)